MKKKIVAMFNLNDTRRDPRVIRTASALANMGCRVIVFSINSHDETHQHLHNFEIVTISIPQSYTNEDMKSLEQASVAAARLVEACNGEILYRNEDTLLRKFDKYFEAKLTLLKRKLTKITNMNSLGEILKIRSIMLINVKLYECALKYSPHVIYANDLDTLLCGYMFKANHNLPLIFDAHEIYPEQLPSHMRSNIWHKFYTKLEKELVRHTDKRLTVCDALGVYFEKEYGSKPFLTIRNCPSIAYLPPESILKRRNKPRKIIYHGAYFPYRGLEEVIQASGTVENAIFVLRGIGNHQTALKELVHKLKMEHRVIFEEPVSIDRLVETASLCDIGLNPFISVCLNTKFALPNKFFEYMMAGLALVSADLVEMRNLTHKHQLGLLYNSIDTDQLAGILNELIAHPEKIECYRSNAYFKAKEEFHWEKEVIKFCDYMREIIE